MQNVNENAPTTSILSSGTSGTITIILVRDDNDIHKHNFRFQETTWSTTTSSKTGSPQSSQGSISHVAQQQRQQQLQQTPGGTTTASQLQSQSGAAGQQQSQAGAGAAPAREDKLSPEELAGSKGKKWRIRIGCTDFADAIVIFYHRSNLNLMRYLRIAIRPSIMKNI